MGRAVLWLCVVVMLVALPVGAAWAQGWGQSPGPSGKAAPGPEGPYITEEHHEHEGEVEGEHEADLWHDPIHYAGIVGTVLAFVVFLGGAVLYIGFSVRGKEFNDPVRRIIRPIHMTGGVIAIALGLTHYTGRCAQMEELVLEPIPPVYAMACFLVVGLSGILRYWTPKPLRKRWYIFAYIHRLAVVGALYFATRHALYQIGKHEGQ